MPATCETIESDGRAIRIGNLGRVGPSGSSRPGSWLELAEGHDREGLGDAPKASSEPRRAQPSRRKK